MNCRYCKASLTNEFADLGFSPPSNAFLTKANLNEPEVFYPLKIMVCSECYLVQIDEFAKHDDIFNSNYVYFSSFSSSWLAHAKAYTEMMTKRFLLNDQSTVIEIASNDGYLLQYFKQQGINVLGIEPTANTAAAAKEKGIDSIVEFFGVSLAKLLVEKGTKADVLLGNNVLAHVPDINDFVSGLPILLKENGVITFEFPHLLQLIDKNQFDTIYHEHFCYLSLIAVQEIFAKHGLQIFDVEEVTTHGGSLRIFAKHINDTTKVITQNVADIRLKEEQFGLKDIAVYENFQSSAEKVKNDFTQFLIEAKNQGKLVAAYGAAAKGNTLLNFAGTKKDLLQFVVDASPHKQNKFLPGVHIPVYDETVIKNTKPDYIVILPWNLKDEIATQLGYIKEWGGKFVVAVPNLQIF